jgi:hypothetical protein
MSLNFFQRPALDRRTLLKAAAVAGVSTLLPLPAQGKIKDDDSHGNLTRGDAAILRFLAAAEILETDLWQQYNELGGIQDDEVPGGSGNPAYTEALAQLDEDMAQYIHDNTENEMTHELFLNAYLQAHRAGPANLEPFRTLHGSKATGADHKAKRLTNLMELTLDTSWWARYRSPDDNPDLGGAFEQAVPDLFKGKFPGIPRTDADLHPSNHLQAIANTAAFHFPSVEVGGTSLYPSLAQRVTDAEVLRVVLSIGGTEAMHFQTWQDNAGNAPAITDPTNGLTFPDLSAPNELLQNNLIMPEPCPFLNANFPVCSIIRPTETEGAATGALAYLTAQGLFRGQSKDFFAYMSDLASDADHATRGGR